MCKQGRMMSGGMRLCACLLNISEARNKSVVDAVVTAALRCNADDTTSTTTSNVRPNNVTTSPSSPDHTNYNVGDGSRHIQGKGQRRSDGHVTGQAQSDRVNTLGAGWPIKSAVLNVFRDYDYNRSVITITGQAENLGQSVFDACVTAYDLIDLQQHAGGHPRLGSVDLVPIHPLSIDVSLDECGTIARDIATRLVAAVPGVSSFLFGSADLPQQRGLVARRKAVRWYDGEHGSTFDNIQADIGPPPTARYGLTGIGAIPYVMNCNVTIATQDVEFGQRIAASIRATKPDGLPGVQSMAFAHEGQVEIACNVEALYREDELMEQETGVMVCSFGKYYHVPAKVIERRVAEMAAKRDVGIVGTALVGFSPEEARRLGLRVMAAGDANHWRTRDTPMM